MNLIVEQCLSSLDPFSTQGYLSRPSSSSSRAVLMMCPFSSEGGRGWAQCRKRKLALWLDRRIILLIFPLQSDSHVRFDEETRPCPPILLHTSGFGVFHGLGERWPVGKTLTFLSMYSFNSKYRNEHYWRGFWAFSFIVVFKEPDLWFMASQTWP